METVAGVAGVSKMTVYSHFADKEALFEAIVASVSDSMIQAPPPGAQPADTPLRTRLEALGRSFLSVVLSAEVCANGPLVAATLRKHPGLARRFFESGPRRTQGALATVLATAAQAGELRIADPVAAAIDLLSLWQGELPHRLAYGLVDHIAPDEIARNAIHGTDVFLRAYRP